MADNYTPKVALATLAEQHLKTLRDTVQHILSTHRAECVFAQVAEGIPTQETARYKLHDLDPQIKDKTKPALEALDLVKNWRSEFHLETLEVDEKVLQAYKDSQPGGKEFKLRLIETTTIIIHSLAALLFEHTNKRPYKCPAPERKIIIVNGLPEVTDEIISDPIPTYLYHDDYLDHDLYPMGVADIVAYWAETHLFGGVVVFDHGESDTEFLDVFLHPDCSFKVFKLSDAQVDQFVSFGLYGEPAVPSPFPIKPDRDAVRLLPEFTMQKNIYRTKSDRRVPELPSGWHPVGRLEDDPQMMEFMDKYKNGDWTYGYNEI